MALATAGPIGGTPGSPTPVGRSLEGTMCTSTSGMTSIRSGVYVSFCRGSRPLAALLPSRSHPSSNRNWLASAGPVAVSLGQANETQTGGGAASTNPLKLLAPKPGDFSRYSRASENIGHSESNLHAEAARRSPAFGHTPRKCWAAEGTAIHQRIVWNLRVVEGRALETSLLRFLSRGSNRRKKATQRG